MWRGRCSRSIPAARSMTYHHLRVPHLREHTTNSKILLCALPVFLHPLTFTLDCVGFLAPNHTQRRPSNVPHSFQTCLGIPDPISFVNILETAHLTFVSCLLIFLKLHKSHPSHPRRDPLPSMHKPPLRLIIYIEPAFLAVHLPHGSSS